MGIYKTKATDIDYHVIDATHRYKLTSSALNGINGSSSFPSSGWITSTNSLLLLTYSGSAAGWSCRTLI